MAYAGVHEAIVGVLRASDVADVDWTKSPYYLEAAEPLPDDSEAGVFQLGPFPYVVYELPDSTVEHAMSDAFVEMFAPVFYVVGTQKHLTTVLSPYASGSVISYLDSLRGTQALPAGYQAFDGDNFNCIEFTRQNYYLGKDPSRGTLGERVWLARASYKLIFNLG